MKAIISLAGELIIEPENSTENFALIGWAESNHKERIHFEFINDKASLNHAGEIQNYEDINGYIERKIQEGIRMHEGGVIEEETIKIPAREIKLEPINAKLPETAKQKREREAREQQEALDDIPF